MPTHPSELPSFSRLIDPLAAKAVENKRGGVLATEGFASARPDRLAHFKHRIKPVTSIEMSACCTFGRQESIIKQQTQVL